MGKIEKKKSSSLLLIITIIILLHLTSALFTFLLLCGLALSFIYCIYFILRVTLDDRHRLMELDILRAFQTTAVHQHIHTKRKLNEWMEWSMEKDRARQGAQHHNEVNEKCLFLWWSHTSIFVVLFSFSFEMTCFMPKTQKYRVLNYIDSYFYNNVSY